MSGRSDFEFGLSTRPRPFRCAGWYGALRCLCAVYLWQFCFDAGFDETRMDPRKRSQRSHVARVNLPPILYPRLALCSSSSSSIHCNHTLIRCSSQFTHHSLSSAFGVLLEVLLLLVLYPLVLVHRSSFKVTSTPWHAAHHLESATASTKSPRADPAPSGSTAAWSHSRSSPPHICHCRVSRTRRRIWAAGHRLRA